jgi:hypothetical protein
MDEGAVIHLPVGIFPDYPFLPRRVIPDVPAVFPEQPGRGSSVGELNQPLLEQVQP